MIQTVKTLCPEKKLIKKKKKERKRCLKLPGVRGGLWQSSAEKWEGQRNYSLKDSLHNDPKSCFSTRKDQRIEVRAKSFALHSPFARNFFVTWVSCEHGLCDHAVRAHAAKKSSRTCDSGAARQIWKACQNFPRFWFFQVVASLGNKLNFFQQEHRRSSNHLSPLCKQPNFLMCWSVDMTSWNEKSCFERLLVHWSSSLWKGSVNWQSSDWEHSNGPRSWRLQTLCACSRHVRQVIHGFGLLSQGLWREKRHRQCWRIYGWRITSKEDCGPFFPASTTFWRCIFRVCSSKGR